MLKKEQEFRRELAAVMRKYSATIGFDADKAEIVVETWDDGFCTNSFRLRSQPEAVGVFPDDVFPEEA